MVAVLPVSLAVSEVEPGAVCGDTMVSLENHDQFWGQDLQTTS